MNNTDHLCERCTEAPAEVLMLHRPGMYEAYEAVCRRCSHRPARWRAHAAVLEALRARALKAVGENPRREEPTQKVFAFMHDMV
jgi:hypothetical protein